MTESVRESLGVGQQDFYWSVLINMKAIYNFETHFYIKRRSAGCLFLTVICLIASAAFAREIRAKECSSCPVSTSENFPILRDLVGVNQVMSAQISPDGNSLFYEIRTTDFDNTKYITELWLAGLTGESQPLKPPRAFLQPVPIRLFARNGRP